jgi:hypothetical protein
MKLGEYYSDGFGTILRVAKIDKDGSPSFVTNDNRTGYSLSSDGYIRFSKDIAMTFEQVEMPIVMPVYRLIAVGFINATDGNMARVRLTNINKDWEGIVIPHLERSFMDDAVMYLNRLGIRVIGRSDHGNILITDDLDTPIVHKK